MLDGKITESKNLVMTGELTSKAIQRYTIPRPFLARSVFESNKTIKRQAGKPVYNLDSKSRGDRIRTCDLVLPKHPRYQAAPRPAHKILVHNMHLLKTKF